MVEEGETEAEYCSAALWVALALLLAERLVSC